MNNDMISREALKKAIHNFFYGLNHTVTEEDIQAYIDIAPTIELRMGRMTNGVIIPIERPHGKWIEDSGNIACSHCHIIWLYRKTDFCPNCGAKMDDKEADNEAN